MRTTSRAVSSFGDLHVGDHRAIFLRQPGEVERANRAAFQMRRHRQDRTRGDDAAAADAGEQRAPRLVRDGQIRLLQCCGKRLLSRLPARIGVGCARRAGDGDEARAEPFEARQIDVAARRIDAALAAERGLHRLDRDAARLGGAVAAVLAHLLVDDDALHRLRHLAALAPAALLGGADLVVYQNGYTVVVTQFALHRVEFGAHMARRAGWQRRCGRQTIRFVCHHGNTCHTFRGDLCGVLRDRVIAFSGLSAGHCDRIVDQELVGDVRPRSDGLADRHDAGVRVGAIAHVGEHVRRVGEWRHADERRALAAHMREGAGLVALVERHEVTADARGGEAALGQARRCAMRAAGTERGNASQQSGRALRHTRRRRVGDVEAGGSQEPARPAATVSGDNSISGDSSGAPDAWSCR